MERWMDLLPGMDAVRAFERARSLVGQQTVYKLGRGGFDPGREMWSAGRTADCSGFISWCLGLPRELPPGSQYWLQTTTFWNGGGDGAGLFDPLPFDRATAGDLLVYPDAGRRQGHIGMVARVEGRSVASVIHCSTGNYRRTGDAILETAPALFFANAKTRLMRVDYDAIRARFGIDGDGRDDEDTDDAPHEIALSSPRLAADPTLRLVAAGRLVLEPSQHRVSGIALVHDVLKALAGTGATAYAVDLGDGDHMRGFFGPRTTSAIKAFQAASGIAASGLIDAPTLHALDAADAALPA